jgi:hypothetical protein
MNGKRMRLEKVVAPAEKEGVEESAPKEKAEKKKPEEKKGAKVISLADLKKK